MIELIDAYLEHASRKYRKAGELTSEYRTQAKVLRGHVLDVVIPADRLGHHRAATDAGGRAIRQVRPGDLRVEDFEAIIDHFARLPGRGRDADGRPHAITVGTVNKYRRFVVQMLRWAARPSRDLVAREVLLHAEAAERIKSGQTKARQTGKVVPIADEVIEGVVAFCRRRADQWRGGTPNKRRRWRSWRLLAIAIEFARQTGCRPGELVQLRLCDVRQDGDTWIYEPPSWKTEHHSDVRQIFLCARALELVREAESVNRTDGGQAVFLFAQDFDDQTRLFPWRSERHGTGGFTNALQRALREAGLPHATGNQLRHTFIDWAARINPELARRQAGHKNLATTTRYVSDELAPVGQLWDPPTPTPTEPEPDPPDPPDPPDADQLSFAAAIDNLKPAATKAAGSNPPLRLVGTG